MKLIEKIRHKTIETTELPSPTNTIKSTPTLWAFYEAIHREIGGGDSDREFDLVAVADDLCDVEPEEEHFDAYTFEALQLVRGYDSGDGGFVLELVIADGETARSIEVRLEFSGGRVQFVAKDARRKKAHRKVVFRQDLVRRQVIVAGGRRRC